MYILVLFFFFFLLLWLVYSYHMESLDVYNENKLNEPTAQGNMTVTGDLIVRGKVTIGPEGSKQWNIQTNMPNSGDRLSLWNTNTGGQNNHGKIEIAPHGDMWLAAVDWMSTINTNANNANYTANNKIHGIKEVRMGKKFVRDMTQMTGIHKLFKFKFSFDKAMAAGSTYGIVIATTRPVESEGPHLYNIKSESVTNTEAIIVIIRENWGGAMFDIGLKPGNYDYELAINYVAFSY